MPSMEPAFVPFILPHGPCWVGFPCLCRPQWTEGPIAARYAHGRAPHGQKITRTFTPRTTSPPLPYPCIVRALCWGWADTVVYPRTFNVDYPQHDRRLPSCPTAAGIGPTFITGPVERTTTRAQYHHATPPPPFPCRTTHTLPNTPADLRPGRRNSWPRYSYPHGAEADGTPLPHTPPLGRTLPPLPRPARRTRRTQVGLPAQLPLPQVKVDAPMPGVPTRSQVPPHPCSPGLDWTRAACLPQPPCPSQPLPRPAQHTPQCLPWYPTPAAFNALRAPAPHYLPC